MPRQIVKNSRGEEVKLTRWEGRLVSQLQKVNNDNPFGFVVDITTLTQIIRRVSEQQFFKIPIADYMPVRVGEGAWSDEILTFASYQLAGDFETGVINTGADASRLASTDVALSPIRTPVKTWAKKNTWSLPELMTAQKNANWDIVEAKERARKTNWDLGIQRAAFLGVTSLGIPGLLNQSTTSFVALNTAAIVKTLSSMTPTEYSAFAAQLIELYRQGVARTVYPDRFLVPESDYNGLAQPTNPDFPLITKLKLLEDAMKQVTMNPGFKILPSPYSMAANSSGTLAVNRYVLFRSDDNSLAFNIPVDYTATMQASVDNFTFQNVGFGQFGGVVVARPQEMLYLDLTP